MCVQVHACRCSGLCVCSMQVQESTAWVCRSSVLCVCVCVWHGCACKMHCMCVAWACRSSALCGGGGGTCGCHVRVLCVPSSGPSPQAVGALPVNICQAQPGLKCLEPLPQLPWVHLPSQHGVSGAWVRGRRHCHRPLHTWCHLSCCGPFGYSFSPSFACNPLRAQMSALSPEGGTCCQVPRAGRGTGSHRPPKASQATGPGGGTSQTPRCPGRLRGMAPPQPQVGGQGPPAPTQATPGMQMEPLLTADGPPQGGRDQCSVPAPSPSHRQLESPGPARARGQRNPGVPPPLQEWVGEGLGHQQVMRSRAVAAQSLPTQVTVGQRAWSH